MKTTLLRFNQERVQQPESQPDSLTGLPSRRVFLEALEPVVVRLGGDESQDGTSAQEL